MYGWGEWVNGVTERGEAGRGAGGQDRRKRVVGWRYRCRGDNVKAPVAARIERLRCWHGRGDAGTGVRNVPFEERCKP